MHALVASLLFAASLCGALASWLVAAPWARAQVAEPRGVPITERAHDPAATGSASTSATPPSTIPAADAPGPPPSSAASNTHTAPWLPAALNADPNGANYGIEYRGAIRGRFGDTFSLYGGARAGEGYGLSVAPLFELHEPRGSANVLPSQYWRARVSLEQGYGWLRTDASLRIALLLTHESDHETAHAYSKPGFLALNDLALRVQLAGRTRSWAFRMGADAQLYLVSCTRPSRACKNFRGDTSAGGQVSFELAHTARQIWHFSPFLAAFASGIVAHRTIEPERRLSTRLGAYARFDDSLLALFVLAWFGNDVGIVRDRSQAVAGAGLSFAR